MPDRPARLAVFLSGRGSGFQALYRATQNGSLDAEIVLVVSSRRDAGGLQLAVSYGIETFVYRRKNYPDDQQAVADLLARLQRRQVEYIALAGYLKLLPREVVAAYSGRVTNIHPALLPKFGGAGMYGLKVHQAVLAAGEKESGATVHLVDEQYDHGRILEQVKVPVHADDTPETLAARVLIEEHKLYPRVLQKLISGEYETTR
ncbi:MAG: phosphoribosylglycinamide formyltransferase [Candidatus Zixiibacteriota bacterium]|nr:MAG: phosphoribosylglycinamide formyltransferase [candidate division Zixibacteria bacterium]